MTAPATAVETAVCKQQTSCVAARIVRDTMVAIMASLSGRVGLLSKASLPGRKHNLPHTSRERLSEATPNAGAERISSYFPYSGSLDGASNTVLYLGYGSNMAASTFEGQRGIQPLSCVSVSAPTLDLTFDLSGLPYQEPCFANTALRKRVPKIPDKQPNIPPIPVPDPGGPKPAPPPSQPTTNSHGDPIWKGGLYGVVYEVTHEDYAKIIATEGGGASYQDLLVPCFEIPPIIGVPEKPPVPEPPRPFLAHTLWAPQLPDGDDGSDEDDGYEGHDGTGSSGGGGDDDDDDNNSRLPKWLHRQLKTLRRRLIELSLKRPRPDPDYAQPSARYLQLLRDGAAEHDLPTDYQEWLGSLAHYEITTCRQTVGWVVSLVLAAPIMLLAVLSLVFNNWIGNQQGRLPLWAVVVMGLFVRVQWWVYDHVLQPVFGDGERTEEAEKSVVGRQVRRRRMLQKRQTGAQTEKAPLLDRVDSFV